MDSNSNTQISNNNDSQQGKGGEGEMKTKELKEVDEVKNEIKRRESVPKCEKCIEIEKGEMKR